MQVVRFKYNRGSHPGTIRTVCFFENESGVGFDLDAKDIRRFNRIQMESVTKLNAVFVNLRDFPSTFDISTLIKAYQNEGKRVELMIAPEGFSILIVLDPQPVAPELSNSFTLKHDGRELEVGRYNPTGTTQQINAFNIYRKDNGGTQAKYLVSSEELVANIKWVLGIGT